MSSFLGRGLARRVLFLGDLAIGELEVGERREGLDEGVLRRVEMFGAGEKCLEALLGIGRAHGCYFLEL